MLPGYQYVRPRLKVKEQSLPAIADNLDKATRKKELTYYPRLAAWTIEAVNMTRKQYAEEIGIGLPRLNSYLNGAAQPPQEICNRIDDAWNRLQLSHDRWMNMIKMRNILDGWAKSVGLSINDTKELAEICGVSNSTISRWRNNEMRPPNETLAKIKAVFDKLKKENTNE